MMTALGVFVVFVAGTLLGAVVLGRRPDRADAPVEVPSAGWDVLAHELERARRFERPFALVRIALPPAGERSSVTEEDLASVTHTVRGIDFVWAGDGGIDVLLPEVGRDEGERCVARLQTALPELARDVRVVAFPDDGVTRGALLARLGDSAAELPDATDLPRKPVSRRELDSATRWAS